MAKQAGRFESCCGGLCGAEAFESCCEAFEGFKACPKRATRQFRSPIETACRANRKAHGGTMAKPAGRFESCCGGLCGAEAFESCCEAFEGFKACPKRATRQFRSPIETACRANRKAHGGTMAKPAGRFESCCGGLCGAEAFESCCEAFEGFKACLERDTRQFRSPIETAFGAYSIGRHHGKTSSTLRKLLRRVVRC